MNSYSYNFNNVRFQYYLRDDVDISVFNEIFKFNEYKSSIDKIISANYPIIDIGAHIGFFSIFAYCLNKKINIYGIEPESNNFELLNKNIKENNFNNIKVFNNAIGSETKNGEIIISEDSINHRIQNFKIQNSNLKTERVKIFSLSYFFKINKLDRVSLVKMDIEGGEYDVFEKLEEETFLRIESFILEYHNLKNKNYKILEEKLRENGFSVQIFPSQFDKDLGFIFAINKRIK